MFPRTINVILGLMLTVASTGCVSLNAYGPAMVNPVFVRAGDDQEVAWEKVVDTVHDFLFDIDRENKLGGIIETKYKTGSNILEPWHPDSVGLADRWESTFQSIRRKVFIRFTAVRGGYLIGVEAVKELEDVPRAQTSVGGATFLDNNALQRDLNPVVGQDTPSGWINRGRDAALEQAMLRSINRRFGQ
jgi:hypothetical protein